MQKLRIGSRYRSQACTTEVIVVKAPAEPVDLTCGGQPMTPAGQTAQHELPIKDGLAEGSLLGKRYRSAEGTVEVLVTKSGDGSIGLGATPLQLGEVKALPASD
jgi:hypothetical protein